MFCKVCEKHSTVDQNFVKGCSSLRIESLKMHEKSRCHEKSVQAEKASQATPGTTPVETGVRKMNQKAFEKLTILFRSCHALAKHSRPFTDYVWQCTLDEQKGVDIGQTYRTDVKCKEFTGAIGEIERQNLERCVRKSRFISVTCDEATDAAVMEQLIIYIRHARGGVIRTDFLSMQTVERATAENCYHAILQAFREQLNIHPEDLWSKLVGFASDGAAVMQGVRNGVAVQLRGNQPKIQVMHCIAHRLELSIKTAIKDVKLFDKLGTLLLDIYLFYHNSPLNRGLLRAAAEVLGITKFIPTRTGGTRWIGHSRRALENLFSGYDAIVQHLLEIKDHQKTSKDTKGKSTGFLKKLLSRDTIEFGHFLLDVLSVLSRLSAMFQLRSLTVGEVPQLIAETVSSLKKLKTRPGPNLRKFQASPQLFHGRDLTGDPPPAEEIDRCVDSLVSCIEHRFPNDDNRVMTATSILDFKSWPVQCTEGFGDREFEDLVDYYGPLLDDAGLISSDIEGEWTTVRGRLYKDYAQINKATWEDVSLKYGEFCPNFMALIDLILTLPAHSVECERGFSVMKKIKSDWRSSLTTDTLTSLMRLILYSPDITDFDPSEAIALWTNSAKRRRRPFQPPYRMRRKNEESEGNIFSDSDLEGDCESDSQLSD